MLALVTTLSDMLVPLLILGAALFGAILFYKRKSIIHPFEPVVLQLLIVSFAVVGFWPLYESGNYTWWTLLMACLLALGPFIVLYRRAAVRITGLALQRATLLSDRAFSVLVVTVSAIVIFNGLWVFGASGWALAGKGGLPELRMGFGALAPVVYMGDASSALLPGLLYLTYRNNRLLFPVVIAALSASTLAALVTGSRVGLAAPFLAIGAAFFLKKLDADQEVGARESLVSLGNAGRALGGVVIVFALVALLGAATGASARQVVLNFVLRFFLQFAGIYLLIVNSFLSPHALPDYSVILTYIKPVAKLLHINTSQVYSNVGEYIAFHIFHLNIWRYPEFSKLPLPNSNVAVEFVISYSRSLALFFIFTYSCIVVSLINFFEKRRYKNIFCLMVSQYLLMSPLRYFLDDNYFIMGLYGLIAVYAVVVVITSLLAKTVTRRVVSAD